MTSPHQPSWQRIAAWLVVAVVGLQLVASTVPHLVVPMVVLATVFCVVRLVWRYTQL